MTQRHVVIVRRQFWPHMSDTTQRILALGQQLDELGIRTTVLSQRPNKGWPVALTMGPLQVFRVDGSSWNPLRAGRYARRVTRWIEEQDDVHAILFDEVGAEALHFLSSQRSSPTTIARFDVSDWGDVQKWQAQKTTLAALQRADIIQVPNEVSRRALMSAGLLNEIQVIEEYFAGEIDRSIGARRAARKALAEVNQELTLHAHERVIVCPGECNEQWNVESFLKSCLPVLESHSNLRLWILGEGNCRHRLYDVIRHHGLARAVAMPGVFTDLTTILQAADLCVFPSGSVGLSALIPTCIQNDIPLLMTPSPFTKELIGESEAAEQLLVPNHQEAWRVQLRKWCTQPQAIQNATVKLRLHKARRASHQPVARAVESWMTGLASPAV